MNRQIIFFFALGFLCCAALAPFVMNLDIFSAIGLAVVITGTVFFIFTIVTAAGFGLWLFARHAIGSLEVTLREGGFLKETR